MKTPAKKKNVKVTQLDRIEGELALVRNALKHVQALAEERSKNDRKAAVTFHEDIVSHIEANRAHLIRIESRLPAPEPKEPEHEADRSKTRAVVQLMLDALARLDFLHECELEAIASGQPSATDWRMAFNDASDMIALAKSELNIEPTTEKP